MNSCFGVIVLALLLASILGVGGTLYYLNHTTEFSRTGPTVEAPPE